MKKLFLNRHVTTIILLASILILVGICEWPIDSSESRIQKQSHQFKVAGYPHEIGVISSEDWYHYHTDSELDYVTQFTSETNTNSVGYAVLIDEGVVKVALFQTQTVIKKETWERGGLQFNTDNKNCFWLGFPPKNIHTYPMSVYRLSQEEKDQKLYFHTNHWRLCNAKAAVREWIKNSKLQAPPGVDVEKWK